MRMIFVMANKVYEFKIRIKIKKQDKILSFTKSCFKMLSVH